ncbi:MAG TPA: hypothetical protein VFY03_08350, partial [Woeseiaceae bacterium]|nr:hypothetical protein [Woeseiaceae bacterium]
MRFLLERFLLSRRYTGARRRAVEFRRVLRRAPHTVSVFLELDDPYSYLLANYLDELASRYAVELRVYLAEALPGAHRPTPGLYQEYALADCRQFAGELGIPFLDKGRTPPVEYRRALLDLLAARDGSETFATELCHCIAAYWRGDAEAVARRCRGTHGSPAAKTMLDRNRALLARLGHYETATLQYGGEWYRGVERLHYLVARLDALGLRREP